MIADICGIPCPRCAFTAEGTRRQRFSPAEDQLIKKLAEGTSLSWDEIAKRIPGRTGRQCKDRYNTYLNKAVVHKDWTSEEDNIIIQKYKELGPRWTAISYYLDGRNGNNVKNRWYKYILKRECNITTNATISRRSKLSSESNQLKHSNASFNVQGDQKNEANKNILLENVNFDHVFDYFCVEDEI